ncbi:hypothetical protein Cyrtocomes_00165 [Candidatus Cyrtobacter comes]|uniref:Porin domain-containing protein n=1 Tax=Candidatus Cyrtobacter comes TaxID=675776 RepID=A0ABU5L6P8_9RICK|nr:hypothetical protein [Candidatus Cyrtobacter comes]MDZ5761807.1 hypothetical protein [Candidatus Cyrtobacter comes]
MRLSCFLASILIIFFIHSTAYSEKLKLNIDSTIRFVDDPRILLRFSGAKELEDVKFGVISVSELLPSSIRNSFQFGVMKGDKKLYVGNIFGTDNIISVVPKHSLNNGMQKKLATYSDSYNPVQFTFSDKITDKLIYSVTYVPITSISDSLGVKISLIGGLKYKGNVKNTSFTTYAIGGCMADYASYELGGSLSYLGVTLSMCIGKSPVPQDIYMIIGLQYEIGAVSLEVANIISNEHRNSATISYKISKGFSIYSTFMHSYDTHHSNMLAFGVKKDFFT